MTCAELAADLPLDLLDQVISEMVALVHLQKEHHPLIRILRSPLANANAVCDLQTELVFDNAVYLSRAESYPGGIQHPIGSAMEHKLFCGGVDGHKVPMRPYI